MVAKWYYKRDGKKHGPFSSAQLQAFAKSGGLQPTDKVWKEGMSDSVIANTIKGLFPAAEDAAAVKKQPVTAVKKQPVTALSSSNSSARRNTKRRDADDEKPSSAADKRSASSKQRGGKSKAIIAVVAVAAVAGVACLGGMGVFGALYFLDIGTHDKKVVENKDKSQKAQDNKKTPAKDNPTEKKETTTKDNPTEKKETPVELPPLPVGQPVGQNNAGGPFLVQAMTRVTNLAANAKQLGGYGYNDNISIMAAWVEGKRSISFGYPLTAGTDYLFLAAGDNDARDIDLAITDNYDNRTVALDQGSEPEAIAPFTPRFTGSYTLKLTLFSSRDNLPCICSLVVLKRDGWAVPFKNLDNATSALATLVTDLNRVHGPKRNKKFDFRSAPNQWAVFGGVLKEGASLKVTNMDLGYGERAMVGVCDGVSEKLDLHLLNRSSLVIGKQSQADAKPFFFAPQSQGPGYGLRLRNSSSPRGGSLVMMGVLDCLPVSPPAFALPKVDLPTLFKMVENPKQRLIAIQVLGELQAKGAILRLIPLLKNEDADIRREASLALEKIGAPEKADYDAVVDFLKDENVAVRVYAARTAGKMTDVSTKTITLLTAALKDTEVDVRLDVVSALAMFAADKVDRARVIPPLLNALADNDAGVREYVKEHLTSLGVNSKADLIAIKGVLKDDNAELRLYAMEILGKGEVNPDIAAIFVDTLKDSEAKVRSKAAEGLGKASADAKQLAFTGLFEALHDRDKPTQAVSFASLAKLGVPPPSELAQLVKVLTHPSVDVRLYSVQIIKKLGGPKTSKDVAALAETLKDEDKRIALLTAEMLGNLGVDARPAAADLQRVALKDSDKGLRREAIVAIGKMGRVKDSLEILVALLDDADMRAVALQSLGKLGPFDKSDLPTLGSILKSNHPEIRSFALNHLSKLGAEAVMLLAEGLTDKEKVLRIDAAAALGEVKGKDVAQILTGALAKETETEVRKVIVVSLGKCGTDAKVAVAGLSDILLERDRELRRAAAVTLGVIGPDAKTAAPRLIMAFGEIPLPQPSNIPLQPVRKQSTSKLQQQRFDEDYQKQMKAYQQAVTDATKKGFEEFMKDKDYDVYSDSLAKIGKDAVPHLRDILKERNKNPYLCLMAIKALGHIGPAAKDAILSLQVYKDGKTIAAQYGLFTPELQKNAELALKRIQTK